MLGGVFSPMVKRGFLVIIYCTYKISNENRKARSLGLEIHIIEQILILFHPSISGQTVTEENRVSMSFDKRVIQY